MRGRRVACTHRSITNSVGRQGHALAAAGLHRSFHRAAVALPPPPPRRSRRPAAGCVPKPKARCPAAAAVVACLYIRRTEAGSEVFIRRAQRTRGGKARDVPALSLLVCLTESGAPSDLKPGRTSCLAVLMASALRSGRRVADLKNFVRDCSADINITTRRSFPCGWLAGSQFVQPQELQLLSPRNGHHRRGAGILCRRDVKVGPLRSGYVVRASG